MILATITHPYYYSATALPGYDFNKEIVEPGTNPTFPDGAVGIRVDDDFWAVAAIPYQFKSMDVKDIVAELWPEHLEFATFTPDSGSIERSIYIANTKVANSNQKIARLEKELKRAKTKIQRLEKGRPDISDQRETRVKAQTNYFVRQYENLLINFAHKFIACEEDSKKGICIECGRLSSDHIHMDKYIKLKNTNGYDMKHLLDYDD